MQVRFWGTRGSLATPGPRTVRYGGNTSCVEVRSDAGTLIVIDCGTGAHGLGLALASQSAQPVRGHLLISHTHWDHIQGIPFFAPLFVAENEWDIYAPHNMSQSIRDTLAGQMQYTYFPVSLEALGAKIKYHELVEGVFSLGDVTVRSVYLNHPALTLGYRFEADGASLVYACDHEPFAHQAGSIEDEISEQDRRHANFLSQADLVIHDAQYTGAEYVDKIGWGHSTAEYAVDLCNAVGVKQLALTHHDPTRDDDEVDQIVSAMRSEISAAGQTLHVFAAAEGATIELRGDATATAARSKPEFSALTPVSAPIAEFSILLGATDANTSAVIKAAAAAEGIRLLSAMNTEDAVQLIKTEQPALVIVDAQSSGNDALALCRAVEESAIRDPHQTALVAIADNEDGIESLAEFSPVWVARGFSREYARTRIRAWILRTTSRWLRARLPDNEAARLGALNASDMLDSDPEERFDRLVRIASHAFDVPIALVSLVDRDRQWFKSCIGLDAKETPRDMAFCAHAILGDEVLIVPDALLDARFADNPLVTGAPRVRFYAGCPLKLPDGHIAGTLCLIDTRPRQLDSKKITLLCDLATLVEKELAHGPDKAGDVGTLEDPGG